MARDSVGRGQPELLAVLVRLEHGVVQDRFQQNPASGRVRGFHVLLHRDRSADPRSACPEPAYLPSIRASSALSP